MAVSNSYGPVTQSERPLASVIIPCYQSAGHIRPALQSLMRQETTVPFEIIVVDSSTDGTDRIVAEEFPQVRLFHFSERRQVGAARNIGIGEAKGEIILFADSDTVPCPSWLDQMCRAIRDGGADAVGGGMANGTPWSVSGSTGFYLEFFRFLAYDGAPAAERFLVGGNSGFRRGVLEGLKYANLSVGEDMKFSANLAREGRKLLFVPRASVVHLNRRGFRTVFGYQRKLGNGAYVYRSQESPGAVRVLESLPLLVFLIPFAMMPWIGITLLRRRLTDFLRFVLILPVCLAANLVWALGLYEALRPPVGAGASK